ncbi:hypothetical protein ACVWZK_006425 [Bradyrhizobium sp. GM0.4]
MTPSLRSFLPKLSQVLGISECALYERQRALVRMGLIPGPTSRGPRGASLLSLEAVYALIASVAVTDHLSYLAKDKVNEVWSAKEGVKAAFDTECKVFSYRRGPRQRRRAGIWVTAYLEVSAMREIKNAVFNALKSA